MRKNMYKTKNFRLSVILSLVLGLVLCITGAAFTLFGNTKIAKAYDSVCTGKEELFMRTFSEKSAKESGVYYEKPWQLIDKFFGIE